MDAWRPSTKKTYSTYLRKWTTFCIERSVNMLAPTLPQACRFLRVLSNQGLGYGAINSARCALSAILPSFEGHSFGTHPYVCWIVKGSYERNPPQPKYAKFWDVNLVFNLLKSWGPTKDLELKQLSLKLAMLLLLVSSQRGQTIVHLTIKDLIMEDERVVFKMRTLLKHNRMGDPLDTLVFRAFPECKRLCVLRTLKHYLNRTLEFRAYDQLLLSFIKPHAPISRDSLGRWTLKTMEMAGIDVAKYGGHSTRGAATSAAKRLGVPLHLILRQASWRSAGSFAKFYDKELDTDTTQVGHRLLGAAVNA